MKKFNRRDFLKTSASGVLGTGLILKGTSLPPAKKMTGSMQVKLGKTGIITSRIAIGTGTHGWRRESDQTRMGLKKFIELCEHGFDKGINFLDVADIYGSHSFVKELLKVIPREKVVILSKVWNRPVNWMKRDSALIAIDRFCKEMGTDHLDIILLHSQVSPNWLIEEKSWLDDISLAKEKGLIRGHGVSCHDIGALRAAAVSDWVEILLARINHTGAKMDGPPSKVMPLLKQAHDRGAGVIGMKVFGNGELTGEDERQTSLEYVWGSGNVDAMTLGMHNTDQLDDNIARISRVLNIPH